ncbi:hypothetical protein ACJMK2_008761 [Sinanodonta woodiana]|uniref:Uncharacterized protein n=1 Tax=Sinanodonta woodiana TaxID=1069815 RepID=A0ABD3VN53_SINWO
MLSVTCNIDSNPLPVSVTWTKDNNSTLSHNSSVLKVNSINKYDRGTYRCTVVNQINPSGENEESLNGMEWFYLNVQYGAEIINISVAEGNTVDENTTATLRCIVDSNPESNITWTKQGIMGLLQTNVSVHESQLIIEHAECLDTSNYTCNAKNGLGKQVESMVTLYVTCYPRTDFRSPAVTTVYSKWHGNASLNYTVISFPEPTFNWSFIGNKNESRWLPDSATQHDNGLQSILMFNDLNISDFGFYRVMARNIFPTSAVEVFQLIPADIPMVPSNVTVTDVKQTSLTVQWVAGYDGGLKQTFHIMIKDTDITRSVYASDPGNGKLGAQTIEDLIPNTEYSISMSANNSMGSSSVTNVIILITLKVADTSPYPMSAIAGGIAAGIVTILLVGIGIILCRRHQHNKTNLDGLKDNPVYDSSDVRPDPLDEYATVDKTNKKTCCKEDPANVYAQVDKTKKTGQKRDMYENATLYERNSNKENVYENPEAETSCENGYENPTASNGILVRQDVLLYTDIMLDPPATKNGKPFIRGLENQTQYAKIDFGKRGEPLPVNK